MKGNNQGSWMLPRKPLFYFPGGMKIDGWQRNIRGSQTTNPTYRMQLIDMILLAAVADVRIYPYSILLILSILCGLQSRYIDVRLRDKIGLLFPPQAKSI